MFYPINKFNEGCGKKRSGKLNCKMFSEGKNPKPVKNPDELPGWNFAGTHNHANYCWEKLRK